MSSFKTSGQELFDKAVAVVALIAVYAIVILTVVYAIECLGPDMSKSYVCECNGVEVGEAVSR